jgi:predicted alpha/beta hydrolase family esterase
MQHARLRSGVAFAWLAVLAVGSVASAQDRPVVFVHGVGSGPETWQEAAGRLQTRLQIAPERAQVSWWQSLESQGSEMDARFGRLPGSTVAVGHSLGGLVARQWRRSHQLEGVITLGTPNRGAPIANHINEWVGFNDSLFGAVGNVFYWLGNVSYDQWWWVYSAVEGSLNWGGYIADFAIYHLLVEMGMQYGVPFVQEVYVGSPYLDDLNRGAGWEAATIPSRVGIVNTASEYWRGGPFRLKNPDYAGELSIITSTAAAALDYWGFHIYAEADALDWQAHSLAAGLWDAAFWLWNFDEFWCRATSDDRPIWAGHCFPNDGFVPAWSQFYPEATVNFEVNGGPVHTQETGNFDEYIYAALTNFMHVPQRGGGPTEPPPTPFPPPPPPPSPTPGPGPGSGGPDSLSPDQALYPGQSISSSDGRFYLTYQGDGNLVLYRSDGVPLWHTQTYGTSAGRAVMQLDGNLVVYDASGTPIWASNTVGFDGAWLVMQSDGNLVIYTPTGAPVWASGTNGS